MPDCLSVQALTVRVAEPMPQAVAAAFTVSDCDGNPVAGLQDADFEIYEDGERNDREAQKVVLDRSAAAFVTIVLDNSSSLADANAQDAVADAALAYIDAAFECSSSVYVAVATFSRNFTTVLEHTSDIEQLRAAIEAYRQDAFSAGTTNLFGAYIDALNYSETAQQNYANRMREGVVTFGQVLFFTDGDDNSEARSIEEAQAALARSADEIFMVGLGDLDVATLNRLGGGRSVATNDPVQLRQAFRNQVARLQRRQESVYALGYCTPRLGGQHTVEVSIAGSPERLPLFNFDATGWINYDGPVCQP
ncbi:MAG: VWA domain-containing protein, partial [Pseudomonadota bacterium]|nr:VWA domain-containing protein [Pseudomonadota bacterium]